MPNVWIDEFDTGAGLLLSETGKGWIDHSPTLTTRNKVSNPAGYALGQGSLCATSRANHGTSNDVSNRMVARLNGLGDGLFRTSTWVRSQGLSGSPLPTAGYRCYSSGTQYLYRMDNGTNTILATMTQGSAGSMKWLETSAIGSVIRHQSLSKDNESRDVSVNDTRWTTAPYFAIELRYATYWLERVEFTSFDIAAALGPPFGNINTLGRRLIR